MNRYLEPNPEIWSGRTSAEQLYLHEKVQFINIEKDILPKESKKSITVLGYACDEGVKRNQGRIGAFDGPEVIRKALAKLPNHLSQDTAFVDVGTLQCIDGKLENIQEHLSEKVEELLQQKTLPIIIGGGHDIAYGHYNGISKFLGKDKTIGIINFDAHFDLRSKKNGSNSGTPFYQISQDCKKNNSPFNYLCLGIRKDANDKVLFKTANNLNVSYIESQNYNIQNTQHISSKVLDFIKDVDFVYVTIDLDGYSSAYAPGVSAPSPMGFSPNIVLDTLQLIIDSKKLISLDIAEMNPKYDIDNHTAILAASLIHFVMHAI